LLFRSHIVPINCLFAVMIYDSFLTETDFPFSQSTGQTSYFFWPIHVLAGRSFKIQWKRRW
jgi:hypothetical protein